VSSAATGTAITAGGGNPRLKPLVGIIVTVGQVLLSAQTALYSAVLVGSQNWLAILTDFAAVPSFSSSSSSSSSSSLGRKGGITQTQTNIHKSILADELCREKIMKEMLARPAPSASLVLVDHNKSTSSTTSSTSTSSMLVVGNEKATSSPPPSLIDWFKHPKKVVTDELYRAVANCRNRSSSDNNNQMEY